MPRASERSPASSPIPAELLDSRYRLDALLGRGGMGAVYRATDVRLDRPVAIKMLRDVDSADEQRFDSEVRMLARFSHPNLVRLFDVGEFDGRPFLVMELIDGATLAQRLSAGPVPSDVVATIGRDIAGALSYVHGKGIVHRDLKPANILLDHDGHAHLADFGIARLIDTTGLTATGLTLGTPAYLAPEQIQGTTVGPAADIYGLGLVLLESLCGHRAFEGTASEITAARLGRDPVVPENLVAPWPVLLRSMTARAPKDRPTAKEIEAVLGRDHDLAVTPPRTFSDDTMAIGIITDPGVGDLGSTTRINERTLTKANPVVPATLADEKLTTKAPRRVHLTWSKTTFSVAGAFCLALLMIGLAFAGVIGGSPSRKAPATGDRRTHTTAAKTHITTPTSTTIAPTTTTSTTTTLPAPTVASAASSFESALQSAVNDGDASYAIAQQLASQLQPIDTTPPGAPGPAQIAAFDQLVQNFDQAVSNGFILGSSTISALSTSINSLATALGTTVPTATTTTTVPGGPGQGGFGNGHGNKHSPLYAG